jgi:glycosyltransferase involved in cell wall biosynthesis
MKILIVQDHLRSGGTERQSVLLSEAFAAAGHRVTLMTFRPGGALWKAGSPRLSGALASPPTRISLQPFDTGLDWFAPRLLSRAASLAPDVILCHGRMANCYAGSLQRALPSAIVIGTLRTGKSLPWLFRRSLRICAHVVANSRAAKELLVSALGISEAKITVIHNSLIFNPSSGGGTAGLSGGSRSCAQSTSDSSRLEIRKKYGAADHATVLICVAMFRPEKNQRELVEIAAQFPKSFDWQLWLVGEGSTRDACAELARDRGVGDRVKLPGLVADPGPLYAAADVAVHASESESLSNFLIESQAAGLPAVAYEAQGIAECMVPGRTGWVIDRGDRESFRVAVTRLAGERPEAKAARSAEARAYARTLFDSARQVDVYLELLARLTRPAAPPPSQML